MPLSRRLAILGVMLSLPLARLTARRGAAEAVAAPPALIERFCADLLAVMKQAKQLSFDQRYSRLAPAVTRTFDLALMTRIAVGPNWAQFAADQQQRLVEAFSRYTVSMYANRFDGYGGEQFTVVPEPAASPNGVLVKSWLVKSNGEKVVLNYLMRQEGQGVWKVIDVYLSGTVSELATRRSEFLAVIQREGAEGLVHLLERRIAELRTG